MQYSRTCSTGMRAWLCTMMNLPPGSLPLGSFVSRSKSSRSQTQELLRDELGVREIGGIPMDVIVEQVAVELGDAGVERIFRPRDRAEPSDHLEAEGRHRVDRAVSKMRQGLGGELAMENVRRDRQAVGGGVEGNPDHLGGAPPPVVMVLGLPAGQGLALVHERRGVEVADAGDVGIEREIAAESKPGGHVQLDDLLAKPAGQHEETAEGPEEVAFGPHRDGHPGQPRQPRPNEVGVARRCHDQQVERTMPAPVLGQQFDQKAGALQVVLAMQATQSERQNGLADFGEHRAAG